MSIKCGNCGNKLDINSKSETRNCDLIGTTYILKCSKCNGIVVYTTAPELLMKVEKKE